MADKVETQALEGESLVFSKHILKFRRTISFRYFVKLIYTPCAGCIRRTDHGLTRWLTPVILALWEAEAGESPEVRSLRPA